MVMESFVELFKKHFSHKYADSLTSPQRCTCVFLFFHYSAGILSNIIALWKIDMKTAPGDTRELVRQAYTCLRTYEFELLKLLEYAYQ